MPNAVTQGDTLGDAFLMAIEMLTGMLHEDWAAGKALPNPSKVEHIEYRDFFRKEFEEELDEDTVQEMHKLYVPTYFITILEKNKTGKKNIMEFEGVLKDHPDIVAEYKEIANSVTGQEHCSIQSRYFSGFFILSVQVLVPSQGQEPVPIAEMDKNIVRLPIR